MEFTIRCITIKCNEAEYRMLDELSKYVRDTPNWMTEEKHKEICLNKLCHNPEIRKKLYNGKDEKAYHILKDYGLNKRRSKHQVFDL